MAPLYGWGTKFVFVIGSIVSISQFIFLNSENPNTIGSVSFSAKFGDRSDIFYEGTFRRSFRLPNRYTILSPFFFIFAARCKNED
ncbi:hypothetical protein FH593_14795 [Leptospira interrogans]|uniref:Uncharacterized protein n=2 Tax=Leptospira interrogans TaxID=173 RepID=M6K792_LEPIR|nr:MULTISPECIES: hypothetical protein [Leptospira]EMN30019.1 hypothetical protein LEP1GSC083_1885 [Leptospira interrogans serovar Pyrogenes str. L0374]AJR14498.1 hypothetical protein LIL_11896 [Leptospira interrogans serovar Linhai str. 56609]EKO08441.1 hypothetical protein LEP1GSC077_1569 [Leptospira interrogans str. C10069]EKO24200.1 hypothetical protein LEP1GSC104_2442 [Leptospira interrogans str. UI 12621]EMN68053.1 hypothetical protein LEP1GSC098_3794 [Leptospira interrogans serovar Gripp